MEPLSERCYPSNFFDPFGDEPTSGACFECGEVFDLDDMHTIGRGLFYEYHLCQECFLKQEEDE